MKAYIYMIGIALLAYSCKSKTSSSSEGQTSTQNSIGYYDESEDDMQEHEHEAYSGGKVSISEDGILSVESDAHPDGGTSPDYWAVFKFVNKKGDSCRIEMDYSPYMQNIHAIHKNDGSTYYTVECSSKASSSDGEDWLQAYRIVGDSIVRVSVIDGGKDYERDHFSVEYCIPDWYFATWGAGYDWMFEYDARTRDLYVPLTDKEVSYILNDRYRLWHFNGERFVDKGERPHKNLHPSLAEYTCLIKYFTTKDYIVRVDSLGSKTLRYASWKKPKTMADAPDVVITGGTRRQFSCAPDGYHRDDEFSFFKDGYEYIANYDEIIPNKDGFGATFHIYLLVKHGKKIVLRQKIEELE